MFIDATDTESVAMFEYLCETNPTAEPYMLELMVWAYKHRHEEFEAIMAKYKDSEETVNLEILKECGNSHVTAHIPEDPDNLPTKDGENEAYNRYIRMLQRKEDALNPDFDTIVEIIN